MVSVISFGNEFEKFSVSRFCREFQEHFLGRVDKTTFYLSGGTFREQNVFHRKKTLWSFSLFSSKKTTNFEQNRSRSVNKNELNEHGQTIWTKPFWKKSNCLRICCGLRAEFYGRFPEAAFYIFKDTFRVETVDRKKTTCNFVFEIWYKNLRTFSEIFPQRYLYCILVVQRHLLGKMRAKFFWS